MWIQKEITVEKVEDSTRFIHYCYGLFEAFPTKKSVKKAIKKGEIRLNNSLCEEARYLKSGDIIQWVDLNQPNKIYHTPLEVIFQDEYLAVVVKPSGMLVYGTQFRTFENALGYNLSPSNQTDCLANFKSAHRLDKETSGLMLVAKTRESLRLCKTLFEQRRIRKKYHAIVHGEITEPFDISEEIDKKFALSKVQPIQVFPSLKNEKLTLVEVEILTGRKHQIRKHLANYHFPIVGDKKYNPSTFGHKGLFLSSYFLGFAHPISGEALCFELPIPFKFQSLIDRETRRYQKYHPITHLKT